MEESMGQERASKGIYIYIYIDKREDLSEFERDHGRVR